MSELLFEIKLNLQIQKIPNFIMLSLKAKKKCIIFDDKSLMNPSTQFHVFLKEKFVERASLHQVYKYSGFDEHSFKFSLKNSNS
ncbi:hypothetical protein BpHYR1_026591 [Brachionus plicatilis]|uniref:Uncharacterized protein n=1 Tax=Brachionus plicatilis TaxID=10195 RepID=A0A3M7P200_BRAPC|nr:hypothetical protein BpHYR1_026591 [Brachionus plicatilis]